MFAILLFFYKVIRNINTVLIVVKSIDLNFYLHGGSLHCCLMSFSDKLIAKFGRNTLIDENWKTFWTFKACSLADSQKPSENAFPQTQFDWKVAFAESIFVLCGLQSCTTVLSLQISGTYYSVVFNASHTDPVASTITDPIFRAKYYQIVLTCIYNTTQELDSVGITPIVM